MAIFADLTRSVTQMLKDDAASLLPWDIEEAIARAVRGQYSNDRPRVFRTKVSGRGNSNIPLTSSISLVITANAALAGATVTVNVDDTLTVLTAGVDWTLTAGNNNATASSLNTAITAVSGVTSTVSTNTITVTLDTTTQFASVTTSNQTYIVITTTTLLTQVNDWGHPASWLKNIEYPELTSAEPRYIRERVAFLYPEFVEDPRVIRFSADVPASGTNNVDVYYHATHTAVRQPVTPYVTVNGTAQGTTYTYRVSCIDADGNETLASTAQTVTNGNGTLSSTNYNSIEVEPVAGAVSYRFYRTVGGSTTGIIGTQAGTLLNDTGLSATSANVPNYNKTKTTVPGKSISPVAALAASYCFMVLAAKHAANIDSALSADAVGWSAFSERYIALAKEHLQMYVEFVKPPDGSPKVAHMEFLDITPDGSSGTPYPLWIDRQQESKRAG